MQGKMKFAVAALVISAIPLGNCFAFNLTPGNYEIKTWIDLSGGCSGMEKTQLEYIDGAEKVLSKLTVETGCDLLSKNITGNTLTYELKCKSGKVETISGGINFMPESFQGGILFRASGYEMKLGMQGRRIGDSPDSKPLPASAKQLDEIDKRLRVIWNSMVSYTSSGKFDKALELFHPCKRKDQSEIFAETRNGWPNLNKEQLELIRLNINDEAGHAFYKLVTQESDGKHSYTVSFEKDHSGNWYIVEF